MNLSLYVSKKLLEIPRNFFCGFLDGFELYNWQLDKVEKRDFYEY